MYNGPTFQTAGTEVQQNNSQVTQIKITKHRKTEVQNMRQVN